MVCSEAALHGGGVARGSRPRSEPVGQYEVAIQERPMNAMPRSAAYVWVRDESESGTCRRLAIDPTDLVLAGVLVPVLILAEPPLGTRSQFTPQVAAHAEQ